MVASILKILQMPGWVGWLLLLLCICSAGSNLHAEEHIGAGEFQHVLGWMREHVHRAGAIDQGEDLIRRVTGSGLDHAPFMRYLWAKYRTLYGLN